MQAPQSVTFVTPGFPPTPGGVEAHVGQLARHIDKSSWQVRVLTAQRGVRRLTKHTVDDVEVHIYPAWTAFSLSLSPRLLLAALRRQPTSILHVHSYHASTGLAMLRRRQRVVFTPHYHGGGHTPLARLLHRLYRLLATRMFANAAAVICVSEAEARQLSIDQPLVRDKLSVIPNGVDVGRIESARPWELGPEPVVLALGRLEDYKRVDLALRAFAALPVPAQFHIVGDGPARSAVEDLCRELGLEQRVTFHGFVSDDGVARWLRTAKVLVSLSEHEAFGMVPLEAAAGGAGVVLSDIEAHRELRDTYLKERAVVVDAQNLDDVATALERQLALQSWPQSIVPTWEDVCRRTVGIYERLLRSET